MANTLYVVVYSSALSAPTSTQISEGKDSTGTLLPAGQRQSLTTTVTDDYSFNITGLTAGTSYKASFWHDDADTSDVETVSFTAWSVTDLTISFPYDDNAQSFTATKGDASSTMEWQSTGGEGGTGALYQSVTGDQTVDVGDWSRTLTFEDLGVPAGAKITGITDASIKYNVTLRNKGDSTTIGPVTLTDGTTTVTLASSVSPSVANSSGYLTSTGVDATSLNWNSNQSVTIKIAHNVTLGNGADAAFNWYWDSLHFEVTYENVTPTNEIVTPTGVGINVGIGSPTADPGAVSVSPTGIGVNVGIGSPSLSVGAVVITPDGVSVGVGVGSPTLEPGAVSVTPDGVSVQVGIGSPTVVALVDGVAQPSGVSIEIGIGSPTLQPGAVAVTPDGVSVGVGIGSPEIKSFADLLADGVGINIGIGSPVLSVGAAAAAPDGVSIAIGIGSPSVYLYQQYAVPAGVGVNIGIGQPSLSGGAIWTDVPRVSSTWTDVTAASSIWTEI